jgi:ApaG protein
VIVDAVGQRHVVEGPGVVGQQPRLEPGQSFEYSSYCPLKTAWGTMEGEFQMRRDDARDFEARVARFYLAGPTEGRG